MFCSFLVIPPFHCIEIGDIKWLFVKGDILRRKLLAIGLECVLESVLLVVLVLDLGSRGLGGIEMATTVKITETYDMKTTINKMGLVGIHTPEISLLRKLYPGLLKNHRYLRFVKCDVVGACASVLPADPLQVGVSEGDVAPEDMFNPILYTAVTNSSWDTIVARIRALSDVSTLGSVAEGQMYPSGNSAANFNTYYALLSEHGRFRKSMPQSGFMIKGLVPLAHTIISNYGNVAPYGNNKVLSEDGETPIDVPNMDVPTFDASSIVDPDGDKAIFFRGKSIKMPRIPIHKITIEAESSDTIPYPNIPETMVLAMVLPPARLHEFWYRMRVTWTCRFEEVCSTLQAGAFSVMNSVGSSAHGQNYSFTRAESEMEKNTDMVSADGVDINKIMES